jgi:hypothetical protein
MALPLPGSFGDAFNRGTQNSSSLFDRLMQRKQAQQQMQQQQLQHEQNFGLQQQQEARLQQAAQWAAEMHPFEMQKIRAEISYNQAKASKAQGVENLLQKFIESRGQAGSAQSNAGIADIDPAIAGLIKKETGIDPYAESPEMKSSRNLRDFAEKEKYKAEQKKKEDLTQITPTVRSQVQEEVFAIQKIKPLLDQLINMEPQTFTLLGTTNDEAYNSLLFNIADGIVKAKRLPQTNESIHKMEKSLRIGKTETAVNYKNRIKKELKDLNEREKKGLGLLSGKNVGRAEENTNNNASSLSSEKQRKRFNRLTGNVE